MNKSDAVIRYIAFYFSVALYLVLLPIVLSYSLGYHIDFHKFKVYKTGILSLTSTPSGAMVYINGKLFPDLTPARIEELKPGTYTVEVKREGFYPWLKNLSVIPNMVTRADNIILFPMLQDMTMIGKVEAADFAIPESMNQIYYMAKTGFYKSNMDGTNLKKLSPYSDWPRRITGKSFSPDGKKILYYNDNGIWVIYLGGREIGKEADTADVEEVMKNYGEVKNAFWHSGSHHIVFVSGRDINVLELGKYQENNVVTLHRCSKTPTGLYYDDNNDSLYFSDIRDGKDCIVRLDLREKFFDKLLQRVKKELDIIYEQKR